MTKIVLDAGHGKETPGKRTPSDEREWSFNDKVVDSAMLVLAKYENVQLLRVDDASGRVDIPLSVRTNKANNFKADVYVSCHHNALTGVWGNHGGVETFVHPQSSQASKDIQKILHANVLKAMGLSDRGLKTEDYHVLRETNMPAVLIEGGFMDSRIDIKVMRDDKRLKAQGEAVARGLVEYFGLKLKESVKPASEPIHGPVNTEVKGVSKTVEEYKKDAQPSKSLASKFKKAVELGITDGTYPQRPGTREEMAVMIVNAIEHLEK
jgi:N-acetylmuramoyl-L-alanine amidase